MTRVRAAILAQPPRRLPPTPPPHDADPLESVAQVGRLAWSTARAPRKVHVNRLDVRGSLASLPSRALGSPHARLARRDDVGLAVRQA